MKLPEPRPDPEWTRLRSHDLEELWEPGRKPHVAASYAERLELLASLVRNGTSPGGRVLDVGCAQGTLGLRLAEEGYRVDLLDVRAMHIEYARARWERGEVGFFVGLLSETMPPRQGYDVVVCTEVIEHVPAPGELLSQLRRAARPGGLVVLTTPNADYLRAKLPSFGKAAQDVIDAAEENSSDGDAHRYLFTREELVALVRGAGLSIAGHGYFLPFWLEGHAKTRLLHGLHYRLRGRILRPPFSDADSRRLCTSQWLTARTPL